MAVTGVYAQKVVTDGAVAYWRLGETSGTSAFSEMGGYTGTITGGVTLNQPGALADGNRAMGFDGTTGYINVPTTPASYPADFTLECWARMTGSGTQELAGFWSPGTTGIRLSYNGSVYNCLVETGAGGNATIIGNARPLDNLWHHYVVTRAGTAGKLYVDGVVDGTATLPSAAVTGSLPIRLGARTDSPTMWFLSGAMDEVALYQSALTARQIADHLAAAQVPAPGTAPYAPVVLPAAKTPHGQWLPVTPSDVVDSPFSALWVGGAGTVAAVGLDGRVVNFVGAQAGTRLRIAGRRVNDTATTATNLLALGRV